MFKKILGSLASLALGAGAAFAQEPVPDAHIVPMPVTSAASDFCCAAVSGPKVWGSAEYLLWKTKADRVNTSLVTTADPLASPNAGALGDPSTTVLFGPGSLNTRYRSGARATLGMALGGSDTVGVEVGGFYLPRTTQSRQFTGSNLSPIALGVPVFDTFTQQEIAYPISLPETIAGSKGTIDISSRTQLWGAEANGVFNLSRGSRVKLDGLLGFRYASLEDQFGLRTTAIPSPSVGSIFKGQFVTADSVTTQDSFRTRNSFYGGQIGAKAGWQSGALSLDLISKIGVGNTHQSASSDGSTSAVIGGVNNTAAGGIFAGGSGNQSHNAFSVIPEVEAKAGYKFSDNISAFAGYNFLYWTHVARAGDQVSHSVDSRQVPIDANYDPSAARSSSSLRQSDFWAHGMTFGVQFNY